MYQLESHNLRITPEVTHYDSNGNKVKTITYPQESIAGEDSNIELTLYNEDGTVKDYFKCPFRSFTQNFGRIIMSRSYTAAASLVGVVDTTGALRTQASYNNLFGYTAPAGVGISTWGIQVGASGSASATSSVATRVLSGLINHGTAKGTLSYAAQTFDTFLTEISSSLMFSTSRIFTNNSAASVNIKEIGLATNTYNSNYKILLARELKDSNGNDINVTVAPAQVLTIKYNIFAPHTSGIHRNLLAYLLSELGGPTIALSINYVYQDDFYNSAITTVNQVYRMQHPAGAGIAWNGIMVGTGTATESLSIVGPNCQYITHGSASGQELIYGANEWDGAQYVFSTSGSSLEWNIKRHFTNGYANPITVNEAMIVASPDATYINGLKTGTKFMSVRKLIGAQTINSGSTLEVNFKFMIEA